MSVLIVGVALNVATTAAGTLLCFPRSIGMMASFPSPQNRPLTAVASRFPVNLKHVNHGVSIYEYRMLLFRASGWLTNGISIPGMGGACTRYTVLTHAVSTFVFSAIFCSLSHRSYLPVLALTSASCLRFLNRANEHPPPTFPHGRVRTTHTPRRAPPPRSSPTV